MTTFRSPWFFCSALALSMLSLSCTDFTNSSSDKPSPAGLVTSDGDVGANPFTKSLEDINKPPFTEEKMLINTGANVIAPQVSRFRAQAEVLKSRVSDYCFSLETQDSVDRRLRLAQDQWIETMLSYHKLQAAPVGPLSDKELVLGSKIYSYPYTNTCGLDFVIARGDIERFATLPFSVKGLANLEYLLFDESLTSSCAPSAFPLTHTWASNTADTEKRKTRCEWATMISADLSEQALLLERLWAIDQGNFTKTMVDQTLYPDLKTATNALSDALFSVEELKDNRLGKPLGLHSDCETGICPEKAEHPYSGLALLAQAETLKFFKDVFSGSSNPNQEGFGFDDYLEAEGAPKVAEEILNAVNRALTTNSKLNERGKIQDQIAALNIEACAASTVIDRKEELCAYQQEVREVVQLLKVELLTTLSLKAPPTFQGDND